MSHTQYTWSWFLVLGSNDSFFFTLLVVDQTAETTMSKLLGKWEGKSSS